MKDFNSYSFLVIGKTQESKEAAEGFSRYIGLASSYVLAVNPTKAELEKIYGREIEKEPEYVVDGENGKEVRIHFIVKTDPETNDGIEVISRLMFTLRNAPAFNRDETKVQVIDKYGNYTWADAQDAKAGNALPANARIDQSNYRMAAVGECDLVGFLKKYLGVPSSLDYSNGAWSLSKNAEDGKFALEEFKEYFKGNFKELKEALAYQPNNKVKLLYGVRTGEDNKQYQTVASRDSLILKNSAGVSAIGKAEAELKRLKDNGSYATTEFAFHELKEYEVNPTNLDTPFPTAEDDDSAMPWD